MRTVRTITLPAYRGMIADRNGIPLAVSTPVSSVWLDPQKFELSEKHLQSLSQIIKIPAQELKQTIERNRNKEFMYLRRWLSPAWAEQIAALNIPGVNFLREYRRYYPDAEVSSHLIGFTNIDDNGQEGIELGYNNWLRGIPGKEKVIRDRLGRTVTGLGVLKEPRPGNDLTLSIDRRIQYLAYRNLKAGFEKFKAKAASVVVLNVKTGEILAMANLPSYNPNQRAGIPQDYFRNRSATDQFEPGSTMKAFSITAGLLSGKFKPTTIIDTNPGMLQIGSNKVVDDHNRNNGVLTVRQVFQKSSNIGVTKMALAMPENSISNLLRQLGFGKPTSLNFPGEANGYVPHPKKWHPFALATLTFGYGVSATVLQLVQAYAVIANHGVMLPMSLLKVTKKPEGKRVLPKEIADQMINIMESVTEQGGTATGARIPGYRVAGKTGTARIAIRGGYDKQRQISSFIGMVPASDPHVLVAVVIFEPQGQYRYGGIGAASVFRQIMEPSLRLLDVPPDNLESS